MQTQCNAQQFEFEVVEGRAVVAAFDGGAVSSDAGALLLSRLDRGIGLIERFAACFDDRRDLYRPSIRGFLEYGEQRAMTAEEYVAAQTRRAELTYAWVDWLAEHRIARRSAIGLPSATSPPSVCDGKYSIEIA